MIGLKVLGPGHGARWFPDGKKLVFTATSGTNAGDLFAVNADGSGRELLLSSAGGAFTNADVYVVDAGGSHARRLTSDPVEDIAGDWSPDGRKVLFTSDRNGRSQIFVMNVDRTHLRNPSGERSNEFDPSWR